MLDAFAQNVDLEMQRNLERYVFLQWGSKVFKNFRVVPPGTGICHQVNVEYLAKVVWTNEQDGVSVAYPDTCVGTDSHTTMVGGMAVLGWGVGGIEAEAAMLGQPISMLGARCHWPASAWPFERRGDGNGFGVKGHRNVTPKGRGWKVC